MTVSELITALQRAKATLGDIPVIVRDTVKGETYDICSADAYPLNNLIQIEI